MTVPQNQDQETLLKTALQLLPKQRKQFLLLLEPKVRVGLLKRLDEVGKERGAVVDLAEGSEDRSAATVVVTPQDATRSKDRSTETAEKSTPRSDVISGRIDSGTLVADGIVGERPAAKANVRHGETSAVGFDGADSRHGSGVELIRLYAKGAIGEVFVAHDQALSREVAIKRIRPELAPNPRRLKRFLREAAITAKLQHPGIVPIYNMGVASGAPHYTMPLVSGMTMAELIRDTHKEMPQAISSQQWMSKMRPLLRHFVAVCNAIDYAHTENVLHRDLKPSNIIIGSQGQTMVLDWGCAKDMKDAPTGECDSSPSAFEGSEESRVLGLLGRANATLEDEQVGSDVTMSGSVIGTVEFMSPEQAAGENGRVGVRSDVFGLGATLFTLLTNSRSVQYGTGEEVKTALKRVCRGQFRKIEELDSRVPPAIAAICKKAMAYSPEERYQSAEALRRDVQAFLAGEVVEAYPEPLHDRMLRLVKRHQLLFTTLAGLLVFGFLSLAAINFIVNRQRGRLATLNERLVESSATEKELLGEAQRQLYSNQMLLASEAAMEAGGTGRMRELVSNWDGDAYRSLRGWEWDYLNAHGNQELWSLNEAFTAHQILASRDAATVKIFDREALEVLTINLADQKIDRREKTDSKCAVVDFNRDQSLIAMGCLDGRVVIEARTSDADTQSVGHDQHTGGVVDVQWSVGGDLLASCDSDGNVIVWHAVDQTVVARGKGALQLANQKLLSWSYDGQQLFWTTGKKIESLDIKTQRQETVLKDGWILNQCQSHEGELLAYIGPDNVVVVADMAGKVLHRFEGHQLFVESVQWHPSKHLLLSSSVDGTVRIWDADTKKEIRQLLGHDGSVYAASFDPTGKMVVSGGLSEDAILIWDVGDVGVAAFDRELQDHPAFAWHPDGKSLVVAEGVDLVIQDDGGDSRRIPAEGQWAENVHGVHYHPTENLIACVAGNGKVWTVDPTSGKLKKVYDKGRGSELFPSITSRGVQWSPDGRFLAGVGGKGTLQVWNRKDGELVSDKLKAGRVLSLAWAPNASSGQQRVAAIGTKNDIVIFDPEKQGQALRIEQYGWKTGLAWSPDGKRLAVSDRRNVNVFNVDDGSLIEVCSGPSAMIFDVDWSKSENRFSALAEDGKLCIWDSESYAYLAKFAIHRRAPYCVRWSPDGKRLVSTARHGRIVFQDAE